MKTVLAVIIIVLLVVCMAAGVKLLVNSDTFSGVKGAYSKVSDAFETVRDRLTSEETTEDSNSSTISPSSGGSSSGSQSDNTSSTDEGSQSVISEAVKEVTGIYNSSLCGLFTIKKSGSNQARNIVAGDVFEVGDTILCDQSTYSDDELTQIVASLQYYVGLDYSFNEFVKDGYYLFGNNCVAVYRFSRYLSSGVYLHVYYINVDGVELWHSGGVLYQDGEYLIGMQAYNLTGYSSAWSKDSVVLTLK